MNSLLLCEGLVTRKGKHSVWMKNQSWIYFLFGKRFSPFVTGMHVDEKGEYQISNFYGTRHKGRVTEYDHSMVQLHVNLKFAVQKPQRTDSFNFKNAESRHFFKDITSDTSEFSNFFQSNESLQAQTESWEHILKHYVVQAFQKIRSRKRKLVETEIRELLQKRQILRLDKVHNPDAIDERENRIAGHLKGMTVALVVMVYGKPKII